MYFEYSCDQVTFIQVFFPNVGSKQKIKRYTHLHTIQKSGLLKTWEYYYFSIISPCIGKGKNVSDNSNLTNLVDIQR